MHLKPLALRPHRRGDARGQCFAALRAGGAAPSSAVTNTESILERVRPSKAGANGRRKQKRCLVGRRVISSPSVRFGEELLREAHGVADGLVSRRELAHRRRDERQPNRGAKRPKHGAPARASARRRAAGAAARRRLPRRAGARRRADSCDARRARRRARERAPRDVAVQVERAREPRAGQRVARAARKSPSGVLRGVVAGVVGVFRRAHTTVDRAETRVEAFASAQRVGGIARKLADEGRRRRPARRRLGDKERHRLPAAAAERGVEQLHKAGRELVAQRRATRAPRHAASSALPESTAKSRRAVGGANPFASSATPTTATRNRGARARARARRACARLRAPGPLVAQAVGGGAREPPRRRRAGRRREMEAPPQPPGGGRARRRVLRCFKREPRTAHHLARPLPVGPAGRRRAAVLRVTPLDVLGVVTRLPQHTRAAIAPGVAVGALERGAPGRGGRVATSSKRRTAASITRAPLHASTSTTSAAPRRGSRCAHARAPLGLPHSHSRVSPLAAVSTAPSRDHARPPSAESARLAGAQSDVKAAPCPHRRRASAPRARREARGAKEQQAQVGRGRVQEATTAAPRARARGRQRGPPPVSKSRATRTSRRMPSGAKMRRCASASRPSSRRGTASAAFKTALRRAGTARRAARGRAPRARRARSRRRRRRFSLRRVASWGGAVRWPSTARSPCTESTASTCAASTCARAARRA